MANVRSTEMQEDFDGHCSKNYVLLSFALRSRCKRSSIETDETLPLRGPERSICRCPGRSSSWHLWGCRQGRQVGLRLLSENRHFDRSQKEYCYTDLPLVMTHCRENSCQELEGFRRLQITPVFIFQGMTPGPKHSMFVNRALEEREGWRCLRSLEAL